MLDYDPARQMPLVSALLALLAAQAQPVPVAPFRYRVELARAGDTTVTISIEAPEPLAGPVTLVVPRAVPMGTRSRTTTATSPT